MIVKESFQAVCIRRKIRYRNVIGADRLSARAEFVGLDVCIDILDEFYAGFGDSKYRACPLLQKMVAAGWLNRESGREF